MSFDDDNIQINDLTCNARGPDSMSGDSVQARKDQNLDKYFPHFLMLFSICGEKWPFKGNMIFTWRPFLTTVCPSNIQTWGSVGHEHFPRSKRPVEYLI